MGRRFLGLAFLLFLTGCDGTETDNPAALAPAGVNFARSNKAYLSSVTVPATDAQSLQDGNLAFALELYRQVAAAAGQEENLFLAPYSVSTVMAMTYAGAQGTTASQMASALHFNLEQAALHPAMNQLRQGLKTSTPTLTDLDAIWMGQECPPKDAYLDVLSEQYDTGVYEVDFTSNPEKARSAINAWVAGKTDGKIGELLPAGTVDELSRLALTNALYFAAPWEYPFDPTWTADGQFTLTSGEQVTVPMMHRLGTYATASGDGWQALRLGYQNIGTSMIFVLPAEGQFAQFETALDAASVTEITNSVSASSGEISLSVPKFSFAESLDLAPPLQGLGMSDAFVLGAADYSGATDCPVAIGAARHSTFVGVDEVGTVATGASATVLSTKAAAPVFALNRPFLFFIWDSDTRTVLFLGRMVRPGS